MKYQVSVIIPNYNGLKFMSMCMPALAAQTFSDFEIIVVDNGSTDGSADYLKKLEQDGLARTAASSALAAVSRARAAAKAAEGEAPLAQNSIAAHIMHAKDTCSIVTDEDETKASAHVEHASCSGSAADCIPLRAILLSENTGFSGAVNAGIAAADCDYVLLLNNDTEADPRFIERLVFAMEQSRSAAYAPPIFAISPKMVQYYNRALLDDAGDGYNLLGWAYQRGVGQQTELPQFNCRREIFSACAGASLYNRALLEDIRLSDGIYFDPMHFAYLEDIDVSFRARTQGYAVYYEPTAVVYHVGSGTSGSRYNSFKVRLAARNNVYLNYKNMPLLQLLLNLPGILIGVLIKYLFFMKKGFGRDYAAGFKEGLRDMRKCRKTPFLLSNILFYVEIEVLMVADTISYVRDFFARRFANMHK